MALNKKVDSGGTTPRLKQFAALASMSALEALRQPICILLTSTCILLTALAPMLLMHSFGEDGKLPRDGGMALHLVIGLFVAGHAACSSLAREIRGGTASMVLSKPVGRGIFFLSKAAGVLAVVIFFSLCSTMSTLMSERVSERFLSFDGGFAYVTDWRTGWTLAAVPFAALGLAGFVNWRFARPFGPMAAAFLPLFLLIAFLSCGFFDAAGRLAPFDLRIDWRIVSSSVLVAAALALLSFVALALSTRLDNTPTVSLCCAFCLAGLLWEHLFGPGQIALARLAGLVVPNLQHFWTIDMLTGGGSVPWRYALETSIYAATYGVGVLCFGVASFRHAEV